MKGTFVPVTRKHDIVVQNLKRETLIYDIKSDKAYCLNETSTLIWQLCDGRKTVSDISDEMSVRLKTPVTGDFVALALDQFNTDDLLEDGGEKSHSFGGLSRREVIRKVGFTTIVALPMVSSVIAPQASMAQSMGGTGMLNDTCTGAGQGTCSPGLRCHPTFLTPVVQAPGTPDGTRCCSTAGATNNFSQGSLNCAGVSCNDFGMAQCCSGSGMPAATPDPACGPFANTCVCN